MMLFLIRGAQNFCPTGLIPIVYINMSTLLLFTHVPMNIHHSEGSPKAGGGGAGGMCTQVLAIVQSGSMYLVCYCLYISSTAMC